MDNTPVTCASGLLSIGVVKAVVDSHHDRRPRHQQSFNGVQAMEGPWCRRRNHHVEAVEDLPARVLCLFVRLGVAAERTDI